MPTPERERILELDVLRGFALFGVVIGNLSEFLFDKIAATQAQLDALPTAEIDVLAGTIIKLFVSMKANMLFAILFGVGFYL